MPRKRLSSYRLGNETDAIVQRYSQSEGISKTETLRRAVKKLNENKEQK